MKYYRCYFLEPTSLICQGADKEVNGKSVFFTENNEKFYICLDNGIILCEQDGQISVKHITAPNGSFSEVRLFTDNRKAYSKDEILGVKDATSTDMIPDLTKKGRKKND